MTYEKKVSICMMIKNEEKNLHRCFESIKPVIDSGLAELIVIDTGSEDRSIEIARQYTEKVYEHPWTNNFSEMRNISISYAKGEWIWIIDADEEIENPKEMIKLFKNDLSKYNTISVKIKNYMKTPVVDKETKYAISNFNRGFRNTVDFEYKGAIHNQPMYKNPILSTNVIFGHYGYIWEDKEFVKKKFDRTAGILKKELEKNPENIYYQFQLAVSYSTLDIEQGLMEISKAYELVKKLPYRERGKYIYVHGTYAKIASENRKHSEIIEICKEGLSITQDYIDLWFLLGISYSAINDYDNAINAFKEYLKCNDRFEKTLLSKDPALTFYYFDDETKELALYNIASIYVKKKEHDIALEYINMMKSSDLKSVAVINLGICENMEYVLSDYFKEIYKEEDIRLKFINTFENQRLTIEQKMIFSNRISDFYSINGEESDSYYLLNLIRIHISNDKPLNEDIIEEVLNLNYNELPYYYGDIIVYIIMNDLPIDSFGYIGSVEQVNEFLKYAINNYENMHEKIIHYLYKNENTEHISNLRYWIVLARHVLLAEEMNYDKHMKLFERYVDNGTCYIKSIYHPNVLKEELIYDVKNDEHRFFLFLLKANKVKEKNMKEYIQYLRKALKVYPMRTGIEILMQEIENDHSQSNPEMELLKKHLKDNINLMIETNMIKEAEELIRQYEEIIPEDVEVLLFKSEIALIKLKQLDGSGILN
ncbi:glycosyltransferase family 2 protein [Alkaliphilus sp. B6464]|uniref:glycosyltransferase family 2 protein n=1 Tax=Alkaliphilus sp. B6464 TaxID=2731219 RepID=UPI001BA47204|nr:glycosyltransferase family 2 protein [Alkaliphilus sp. B6464]QUH19019.1 glycosyltransferase [Alkaliphilus sp. B6464]